MFCSKCGKEVNDDAVVCINCGCAVNSGKTTQIAAQEDIPNGGLNILGFLIPVVGLIMFCVMHGQTPRKANQIGLFSLVGFILAFILFMSM